MDRLFVPISLFSFYKNFATEREKKIVKEKKLEIDNTILILLLLLLCNIE